MPVVFVIVGVLIAGSLFYAIFYSRKAVVKRALKKTPYRRISEFTQGEKGRVVGKIVFAGQVLTAPLSGRRCAAFHVVVEEYRRSGKSGSWVTIINEEVNGDIVINDGMGYAYVPPAGLKTYFVQDAKFSSGTFNDASQHLEAYLSRHGRASTGMLGFNKSIRYREGILEEHEIVAAVGTGTWGSASQRNLNIARDRILYMSPDEKGKLYLSDDPDVIKTE